MLSERIRAAYLGQQSGGLYTANVFATRSLSPLPRSTGALALLFFVASPVVAQVVPWQTTLAPAVDSTPLPQDRGADGLAQTLNKLRTWASLLMIVAHPDDEDGGMMAYESRGAGVRTALMTLTRGEGGQNAMSGETYDALGLVRTNELLLADRYSGTEQIWATVADYGFSKTKEEAFSQWGHDRVLRDVVRAVREQRPLVLTSVFLGGITDGHGHHQVAGELAQEAFNAAGDPAVFPDQIAAGLRPWKPLAVFARVPFAPITARGMYDYATDTWAPPSFTNYVTGAHTATPPAADITIPEGQWDPVLGRSYLEMAREGWGLQKSQNGGGNPPLSGPDAVGYHRYGSRLPAQPNDAPNGGFFAGVDTSLRGMALLAHPSSPGGDTAFVAAGLDRIERAVTHAFWGYTPAAPLRIVPDLCEGYRATEALLAAIDGSSLTPDSKADLRHELGIKLVQWNTALIEALGLHLDALVTPTAPRDLNGAKPRVLSLYPELSRTHVTPGESFDVRLHVTAASPWSSTANTGLSLVHTGLETPAGEHWEVARTEAPGLSAAESDVGEALFRVTVPRDAAPTAPYFTRPSMAQPFYNLSDPALAGRSFGPYPVSGSAEFSYNGIPLHLAEVVQGVERVRGPGTFTTPLVVTPALSVTLPEAVAVLPTGVEQLSVAVAATNEQDEPADTTLSLAVPGGWQVSPASFAVLLAPGEREVREFTVRPPDHAPPAATLQASARAGNFVYSSGFQTVGYLGLRPYNLYRPAVLDVHAVGVQVRPGARVGYVMGTGDEVPAALEALGVTVDRLTPADLLVRDLHVYSTLMLGVRTYTADPALASAGHALQEFAAAGGTVVIQYQSSDFPGVPFALHLTGSPAKVVDEHAPVSLLAPANPLFTTPNRITPADFDGWLEERGHGFAASWAPEWMPLVATADPDQETQRGGLLVATVGRGRYVYLALALYRQLPEGVPGAYRLLANLVSQSAH